MKPLLVVLNSLTFGSLFPEHMRELEEHFEVKRVHVEPDCGFAELTEALKGAVAIIASVTPKISRETIEALPELRIIARHGIGYDSVDVAACSDSEVLVTRVSGELERDAVAEHAVALLMTAGRHVAYAADELASHGNWSARKNCLGIELRNKKIGLIGHGNIGSCTAEILAGGFGCEMHVCDPAFSDDELKSLGYVPASCEDICKTCPVILLHCDLNDSSKGILGKEQFARMQDGVIIVNTARGELVDEEALIAALDRGKVDVYASDVVAGEPVDNSHPLVGHKKTLITSHIGNLTHESLRAMGESMVSHVINYCNKGEIPKEAINGESISERAA